MKNTMKTSTIPCTFDAYTKLEALFLSAHATVGVHEGFDACVNEIGAIPFRGWFTDSTFLYRGNTITFCSKLHKVFQIKVQAKTTFIQNLAITTLNHLLIAQVVEAPWVPVNCDILEF